MKVPAIPAQLVREVLDPMGVVSVKPLPPGMSGARVFRLGLRSGELRVLKQWPPDTPVDRIAEVDRIVTHSRERGCALTPQLYPIVPETAGERLSSPQSMVGATYRLISNACWQVMQWMPGQPLQETADLESIECGAAAIADFHRSVADLGSSTEPAAAIGTRLRRAAELKPLVAQLMAMGPSAVLEVTDPQLEAALFQARQLVIWKWDEVADTISRSLNQYVGEPLYNQFVLRDVHRENALFVEGRPTGLIDFDAVRIDTPWTDLARWVGSFLGGPHPSTKIWEASMAGFSRNHPLNQGPEMEFGGHLARDLSFATNWIGLANWLVWLVLERRSFAASASSIASRIEGLRRSIVS
jgi:Ser/Thr protein kinase RdoA (MazF antagonist)